MANRLALSNKIITTSSKFVEVMAAPGSGKTFNLIKRINHLITIQGVPSNKILALSHSTATVRELKSRIKSFTTNSGNIKNSQQIVSPKPNKMVGVVVSTIHSLCLRIIKKKFPNTEVMVNSDGKKMAMLTQAIESAKKDKRHKLPGELDDDRLNKLAFLSQPRQMKLLLRLLEKSLASRRKLSESMCTSEYKTLKPYLNILGEIRRLFYAVRKKQQSVDFSDMLVRATKIIADDPDAVPYTHILVDEYQDCTAAQRHLLVQLAKSNRRSIMVVSDEYQAVYGFAGSNYVPLSSVLDNVMELSLSYSWRLTAETAATATAICHGANPIQTNRNGERPRLIIDSSLTKQIKHVTHDVKRLLDRGTAHEKIVVLARTKALLGPVEQLLLANNIQTTRMGMRRDSKHGLTVLRLVRLVEIYEKHRNLPKRVNTRIAEKKLRKALPMLQEVTDKLWHEEALALIRVSHCPSIDGRYCLCSAIYLRLMGGVRNDPALRAEVNRWEPFCRGHSDAMAVRKSILALDSGKVVTGTIHAAKGGEWEHVLIVGATEGLLPFYLARDDAARAEERRLLYVAVTRARESVRLYHAPTHHARSRQHLPHLSSFLDEKSVQRTLLPRRAAAQQ